MCACVREREREREREEVWVGKWESDCFGKANVEGEGREGGRERECGLANGRVIVLVRRIMHAYLEDLSRDISSRLWRDRPGICAGYECMTFDGKVGVKCGACVSASMSE